MGDLVKSFLEKRAKKLGFFNTGQSGPYYGGFLSELSLFPTITYQFVLSVPSVKTLVVTLYCNEISVITDLGVAVADDVVDDQQVYLEMNTLKKVEKSIIHVFPDTPMIRCMAFVKPSRPSKDTDDAFLIAGWTLKTGLVLLNN